MYRHKKKIKSYAIIILSKAMAHDINLCLLFICAYYNTWQGQRELVVCKNFLFAVEGGRNGNREIC